MRQVRLLLERARAIAPEALRFGAIGLANTVLYFLIFNVTMGIGAVKATVIATVVTTTLSYLANRHWTYRHRPKTDLRREYILFFAFNLAGMVIQSGAVAIGKYGLDLNESTDRLAFNAATCVGITLATLFRFWSYRTLVFIADNPAMSEADVAAVDPLAVDPLAVDPLAVDAASPTPGVARLGPTGEAGPPPLSKSAATAPHPRAGQTDFVDYEDALDVQLAAELATAEAAELDHTAGPAATN